MSRKTLNVLNQKEQRRVKKTSFELLTDLYRSGLTKKEIAKRIGVSDRTLRAYTTALKNEANVKQEFSKYDIKKVPDKVKQKIKKLAKGRKWKLPKGEKYNSINLTRTTGKVYEKVPNKIFELSKQTEKQILKQRKEKNYFGLFVRCSITIYTKHGIYNDWISVYNPKISNGGKKDIELAINHALRMALLNKPSILGIQLNEIIFDVKSKEYEKTEKNISVQNTKQVRKVKTRKDRKTKK